MKTVFVDVDTQVDFLYPAGALYVPGGERLLPAIRRLNLHAAEHGIPLVSTTDAHAENDPEFRAWPPHCVAGTNGQLKPAETLLPHRVTLKNRPGEPIEISNQVVVEKQALDVFTNANFSALLDRLQAERYVVYGVATEHCVRCAAMGLLHTGKPVIVVTDAIAAVNPEAGTATLADFTAAGGTLATVAVITASCFPAQT